SKTRLAPRQKRARYGIVFERQILWHAPRSAHFLFTGDHALAGQRTIGQNPRRRDDREGAVRSAGRAARGKIRREALVQLGLMDSDDQRFGRLARRLVLEQPEQRPVRHRQSPISVRLSNFWLRLVLRALPCRGSVARNRAERRGQRIHVRIAAQYRW